jgi:hypothetical protein
MLNRFVRCAWQGDARRCPGPPASKQGAPVVVNGPRQLVPLSVPPHLHVSHWYACIGDHHLTVPGVPALVAIAQGAGTHGTLHWEPVHPQKQQTDSAQRLFYLLSRSGPGTLPSSTACAGAVKLFERDGRGQAKGTSTSGWH